jgi:hypothetical protein
MLCLVQNSLFTAGVSNPRSAGRTWPSILCYAARCNVSKLYVCIVQQLRNDLSGQVYHLLWFLHKRTANQSHENGCGPLWQKLGTP